MDGLAAGTIVAKHHLALGRVAADSFARHHPEIPFFVLLADEVEGYFDPRRERFRMLRLSEVGIGGLARMRFHYNRQELSYAATPYLLAYLLDQGFRGAVFVKEESLVLGDMSSVLARLERHPVLLTPHLLAPLAGEDAVGRELNVLLSGVYNGGFVGFSDAPEARRFLAWWQDRVFDHCLRDVGEGMHFEQRWLDFAPAFVENPCIVRDAGMNVAHWNLPERDVRLEGGVVRVDGVPCRLFRFSGFDPDRPEHLTGYSPRLTMANARPAAEVFRRYMALLEEADYHRTKHWPYAYDRFDNGAPVPGVARRILREMGDAAEAFGDPLRTAAPGSYFQWLNAPVDGNPDRATAVTRLWHAIYESRPDVRLAFPDPLGEDRRAFLDWTVRHGAREYGVGEAFLPPLAPPAGRAAP